MYRLAIASLAFVTLAALPASAQVKPRFVIAFDTSGSMAVDLNDIPTYGDGVLTNCTAGVGGMLCGSNCTAGIDTDCDGLANDSRMAVAKNALRNMILAFGDVEFSLARFPNTSALNSNCPRINDLECSTACLPPPNGHICGPFVSSYGNPQCNTGTNIPSASCPFLWEETIPLACRPGTGGRPGFREFGGLSPTVCTNYNGACNIGGRTGDFLVDFTNTGAFVGQENTYPLLRWIDNQETSFNAGGTIGNFCNHLGGGDCELRPSGGTPLAGLLNSVRSRLTGTIIPGDAASACRPYSVILLTDGGETCGGAPNAAATALRAAGIDVYVIGLAVSAATVGQLNGIASAGGTGSAFLADDPDTLSASLAAIIRDSLLIETCDNTDEDCDGLVDEGFPKFCSNPALPANLDLCMEPTDPCDGIDSDCDGTIDEGTTNACGGCGALPAEICDGVDNNCNGVIDEGGVCSGCVPSAEICDNVDNDCDGRTDETISQPCGTNVGECSVGVRVCTAGSFGMCTGQGPVAETCNNRDDDCDGVVDGNTEACGSSVGACRPGTRICSSGSFGSCVGATGPTAELCDNADNDCDNRTDESPSGVGVACGTAAGICTEGSTVCVAGMLECGGGTGGRPETCNGLDDDCDGLIDEGNPGGGAECGDTSTGECDLGREVCDGGAIVCRGESGPTAELCDGRDNDCDGSSDEGNPEAGAECGDGTGECVPGTTECTGGTLICMGEIGPTMEICDGLDNNCNGVSDEGIGVGAPCGSDAGECSPGVNICRDGMLVCDGAMMSREEVCNSLDDDCDGLIDESLPLGAACGDDMGVCMPGALQCIDGDEICVGEVPAGDEVCDCGDNDCDGVTDEDVACPGGSSCIECACSSECRVSEFGVDCPSGKTPFFPGGAGTDECFCVTPRCEEAACGLETVERDEMTLCAPGDESPDCTCRNNECTFPCDGVVCMGGTVCRPDTGRCVEDSCRGLGCPGGEICDVATGACGEDPCEGVMCAAGEACRNGECEGTCAGVECPDGQLCRAGMCEADICDTVSCTTGFVCDPTTGDCAEDMCVSVRCPIGLICDPLSGECNADPCDTLMCPDMQECRDGECVDPMTMGEDAGVGGEDSGTGGEEDAGVGVGGRVLASGGGGCACDAAGSTSGTTPLAPFGFIVVLLGLFTLRRRTPSVVSTAAIKRVARTGVKVGGGIGAALAIMLSGGCEVDPFCLTCGDATVPVDAGPMDMGAVDSNVVVPDVGPRDAGDDVGDIGPDTCLPAELCNDIDDDCDGEIDEDIDTQNDINNCGGCAVLCAPTGAFGECVAGACTIGECDVNAHDLNGDPADGCEYRCLATAEDDVLCDLRDNDCDGNVDEDVVFDSDPVNCGSCARVCRFAHVTMPQCVAGACAFDDGDCETGFYDINDVPEDGCEYTCTPSDTGIEICNGRDDNCDGNIDEGNPGSGAACGSNTGLCSRGTEQCVAGAIVCIGSVEPATEACNGDDDDCDGLTDENNPDGGRLCGESVGTCTLGRETCVAGALSCVGGVDPVAELCDGLDNDCNGAIDNGNPGGGASCGIATGVCVAGAQTCSGGTLTCVGAVGGGIETCNSRDDDCDGDTDEDFAFSTDVNNCGSCGRTCSFSHGFAACGAGACVLASCDTGFVNADGNDTNGCEYACEFSGAEVCNGRDDDCDGRTDESITPPSNFCNPNGVCSGTRATCGAAAGWECNYPASQEAAESRCDGLDNDCDGRTDESFPALGNACSNGTGGCQRTGSIVCNGAAATRCNAAAAGTPGPELCNNIDDNCNGVIDDGIGPAIPVVTMNRSGGGGTFDMMRYEASRPDADASSGGSVSTFACSQPNVMPWINVTWAEARDACGAIGAGWALCREADWEVACEGPSTTCDWSYSSSCSSSSMMRCNGEEYDSSGAAGDQDALLTTGSPTFPGCYTRWAAGTTNRVYDLSGNVKEWTSTERGSSNVHAIRGGSYNNVEDGRTCGFDFTVGDEDFAFINTGFRCCRY